MQNPFTHPSLPPISLLTPHHPHIYTPHPEMDGYQSSIQKIKTIEREEN